MSGYWAMGKPNSAMAPARVTKMDSTDAKIGRLMKKFENTAYPWLQPGYGRSSFSREPRAGAGYALAGGSRLNGGVVGRGRSGRCPGPAVPFVRGMAVAVRPDARRSVV